MAGEKKEEEYEKKKKRRCVYIRRAPDTPRRATKQTNTGRTRLARHQH